MVLRHRIGFGSATGLLSPGDRRMSERVLAEIDQEVQVTGKLLAICSASHPHVN